MDQREASRYSRNSSGQYRSRSANASAPRGHAAASRHGGEPSRYSRQTYASKAPSPKKGRKRPFIAAVAVIAVIGIGIGAFFLLRPVDVTINGKEYSVGGSRDLNAAVEVLAEDGVTFEAGDLLAVDDQVLSAGEGRPWDATVNGEAVEDGATKLEDGDDILLADGSDLYEEYDGTEKAVPWIYDIIGSGSLHVYEGSGADGVETTMVGKISKRTAVKITTQPDNVVLHKYHVDTNGKKVVAITFDDGPWYDTTQAILDILAENGAKATFFVIGSQAESDWGAPLIKAEQAAGHQICTHSYDHAEGSGQGVNLGYMTANEQVQEIEKGRQAIANALGCSVDQISRVFRAPGGNFSEEVFKNLFGHVTSEIFWDIDTRDWARPGSDAIYARIVSAGPGDIILCHDGGGDRWQTVEALRSAIPELVKKGYEFITIDELLKYPAESE